MSSPSPSTRELARRLLALEAARPSTHEDTSAAVRVCERLRVSLTRFAGPDGFASLLRRALTLARAEVPSLQAVTVVPDGRLEGFETVAAGPGPAGADAAAALTAHLLELLVTFVGTSLTLRLVRDAWPDASLDE